MHCIFATHPSAKAPHNAVMQYLVEAQQKGLVGLWARLCDGGLPARCDKKWYFGTFCNVKADAFDAAGYEQLNGAAPRTWTVVCSLPPALLTSALPSRVVARSRDRHCAVPQRLRQAV